ncbi:MAG: helix-turn-helix transcriptional regulator [Chloroflexi bacterium]|nr:MAG: helix-turn-helix transcriptional regulator [Chloroflexota bacterium]
MPTKKRKQPAPSTRYDSDAAFVPASLRDGQFDFVKVSYHLNPEAQALKEHLLALVFSFVEQLGLSLTTLYVAIAQQLNERPAPLALPAPAAAGPRLTKRELEIVALMAHRYTNEQIADLLVISMNTMKTHVRHIRQKLGNRGQILAWWEQHKHEYPSV